MTSDVKILEDIMFLNMEQQPRRATVFIVPHRPVRTAGGVPPITRGGVCGTAIIPVQRGQLRVRQQWKRLSENWSAA
ncbi:hypothetical protein AWI81_14440 [Listeria monocytogenes]|nr:hypothetical protein AWI81_14440 [Listeria monocytogenes]